MRPLSMLLLAIFLVPEHGSPAPRAIEHGAVAHDVAQDEPLSPGQGSAQPARNVTLRLLHDLARIAWHEGGASLADAAAVAAALRERARIRRVELSVMARWYSGNALTERARQSYIPHLRLDGERPELWDGPAPWSEVRPQWLGVVAVVRAVLVGELPSPCSHAVHWSAPGCSSCRRRMARYEHVRVVCLTETANDFWAPTIRAPLSALGFCPLRPIPY